MKSLKLVMLIVLSALGLKSDAQNAAAIYLPLGGNAYSSLHQDTRSTTGKKPEIDFSKLP